MNNKRGSKQREMKESRITAYKENPKICKGCPKNIPYNKRQNTFCGKSCSATYNNRGTRRHGRTKTCIQCGERTQNKKYCDRNCQSKYEWSAKVSRAIQGHQLSSCEDTARGIATKMLIESEGRKCYRCGLTEWMGEEIPLCCDHIDGYTEHNELSNFRLVCPNCDRQSDTRGVKNKGKGKRKKK